MFTVDSFCNYIWGKNYSKISIPVSKTEYKTFVIPKKNGTRRINYLKRESELWNLQYKLLSSFLEKQPLPVCVKGFRKGESYKSFLSDHIGANFFLRIDISSFFPSIGVDWIRETFAEILLVQSDEEKTKLVDLLCDIVSLNDSLPQGACTSPTVSNLVMARLDQRITKYCQVFDISYTRYADDLLFSSKSFNFRNKKWFLKKIRYILNTKHLYLNYSKLKYGEHEICLNGYVIFKEGLRLSRNRLSDIRHVVSFSKNNHCIIKSQGTEVFLKKANLLVLKYRNLQLYPFKTFFQFIQYLCGYRAFLISIIDNDMRDCYFQKELQKLIRKIEEEIDYLH